MARASRSIDMNALRPGTPGSFGTGARTPGSTFESYQGHGSATPTAEDGLMQHQQMQGRGSDGTYYFNKEGGAGTGAGAAAASSGRAARAGGPLGFIKRHPYITGLVALIALVAIGVGAGVGGSMASKNADGTSNAATKGSDSGTSGSSSSGKGGNSGSTANNNTTDANAPLTPLPKWSFTDPNQKMVGVNIGNWLVLERWLSEDWFTQTAGDNAYDEWDFTQSLGKNALSSLQDHWNTWVTEADIDTLVAAGINTFRLNVGYWAFVPAAPGEPYLAMSGQKEQLDKMLGWLYDRNVYAVIDLHGMPGSQNGDQSSGHRGNIGWFTPDNIGRSYDTVNAVVAWLSNHKYKSVVHSVGIINEPQSHNDDGRLAMLTAYYEGTYQILSKVGLTTFFHHAFVSNQKPLDYWRDFATGKDPNLLVYEDHPYPGYFPLNSDADAIVNVICDLAQQSVGYPVPVSYMEWSAVNGVKQNSFTQNYYNTQLSAFAWSAGSTFWTFKALHSSNPREAIADNLMDQYSLITLIANGVVAKNASVSQSLSTIKALPNQQCGNIPTAKWSNPSKTGAGYSGRRRDVSEEAAPQQHLVRRMRSKRSMGA